MSLQGKLALVTGAGRGIGAAIAHRLSSDGAEVILADRQGAQATAAKLVEMGRRARGYDVDISRIESLDAFFEDIDAEHGRLDILVNNAGRGSQGMPTLMTATVEDYDSIYSVNSRGTFFVTQGAAKRMNDGGRIVSVSSSSTQTRVPGLSIYAGSKASIDSFTRVWATELASRCITVNAVLPGIVDTNLIRDNMPDAMIDQVAAMVPLGRLGQPGDIADVVAFLCSEDARWVSGQGLVVAGGA